MTDQPKPALGTIREALTLKRKEVAKHFSENAMQGFDTAMDVALSAPVPSPDGVWQNIDRIIDALEDAGCCRNGQVMAPEDHVANTIRNWLRSLYGISPIKETKQTFYTILSRSIPQDMIDGIWQEIEEAGIFK